MVPSPELSMGKIMNEHQIAAIKQATQAMAQAAQVLAQVFADLCQQAPQGEGLQTKCDRLEEENNRLKAELAQASAKLQQINSITSNSSPTPVVEPVVHNNTVEISEPTKELVEAYGSNGDGKHPPKGKTVLDKPKRQPPQLEEKNRNLLEQYFSSSPEEAKKLLTNIYLREAYNFFFKTGLQDFLTEREMLQLKTKLFPE